MSPEPADDGELEGERPPLVKPGEYDLRFIDWSTRFLFGRRPKLTMRFRIITMGEYFDQVTLCRHYNATRLIGKPALHGRFKVGWHSDFYREYASLFRSPTRPDRVAMTAFDRVIVIGKVITVTRGHDQREIPECLHYSVIQQLVRVRAS